MIYQDIHIEDYSLQHNVLDYWENKEYEKAFEILRNQMLAGKVLNAEALNNLCDLLIVLQTQQKDIGKDSKIKLVQNLPISTDVGTVFFQRR